MKCISVNVLAKNRTKFSKENCSLNKSVLLSSPYFPYFSVFIFIYNSVVVDQGVFNWSFWNLNLIQSSLTQTDAQQPTDSNALTHAYPAPSSVEWIDWILILPLTSQQSALVLHSMACLISPLMAFIQCQSLFKLQVGISTQLPINTHSYHLLVRSFISIMCLD